MDGEKGNMMGKGIKEEDAMDEDLGRQNAIIGFEEFSISCSARRWKLCWASYKQSIGFLAVRDAMKLVDTVFPGVKLCAL